MIQNDFFPKVSPIRRQILASFTHAQYRKYRLAEPGSGAALLDLHGQFLELPRLRQYRWYVFGMTSLTAMHGAMALASCLLEGVNIDLDLNRITLFSTLRF
jgi:hypothetical protein